MNQGQIEQYVAGHMGEAEALAFEEYCLANPEFARQVEYEQRLNWKTFGDAVRDLVRASLN